MCRTETAAKSRRVERVNMIPLSIPNFEGNEEKYALDAVREGWVSTGGAYIGRMEEMLARFLNAPQTAACQSGTAALHLALRECGVEAGDLVIVPTLTFIAAVNPVRYQGADPVFMDCDDSLCMDPVKLRAFCEEECEWDGECLRDKRDRRRVRAIVVVHVFGNLADMEAIMSVAEEFGLPVIEDATEALGSRFTAGKYAGMQAGTIGAFGAYSFNGNKIITTGGGGAVTARDRKACEHIRYLSTQAKDDELFYIHREIGFNYRMTNLQAAVGVAQMEMLPEFLRRKEQNYRYYREAFAGCETCELLPFRPGTAPNYWFYSLLLYPGGSAPDLRGIIAALRERGVQTRPVWGLIHEQKPYAGMTAYRINAARDYAARILNIPCSTQLTKEEILYVADAVREVLSGDRFFT